VLNRNKHIFSNISIILIGLVLFGGCSSTKFVPDDKYLLSNNVVHINQSEINREELNMQVVQKENLRILGFFKFHLLVYNLSGKNKEKGVFKRIGEAPVIYDDNLRLKSAKQLKQYLITKGITMPK